METPDHTSLMLDDLARRVATITLEAAQWRARAIKAEALVEELKAQIEPEEQEDG